MAAVRPQEVGQKTPQREREGKDAEPDTSEHRCIMRCGHSTMRRGAQLQNAENVSHKIPQRQSGTAWYSPKNHVSQGPGSLLWRPAWGGAGGAGLQREASPPRPSTVSHASAEMTAFCPYHASPFFPNAACHLKAISYVKSIPFPLEYA